MKKGPSRQRSLFAKLIKDKRRFQCREDFTKAIFLLLIYFPATPFYFPRCCLRWLKKDARCDCCIRKSSFKGGRKECSCTMSLAIKGTFCFEGFFNWDRNTKCLGKKKYWRLVFMVSLFSGNSLACESVPGYPETFELLGRNSFILFAQESLFRDGGRILCVFPTFRSLRSSTPNYIRGLFFQAFEIGYTVGQINIRDYVIFAILRYPLNLFFARWRENMKKPLFKPTKGNFLAIPMWPWKKIADKNMDYHVSNILNWSLVLWKFFGGWG